MSTVIWIRTGEESHCLRCDHLLNAAGAAEDGVERAPAADDFAICLKCGHLQAYGKDGFTMRPLTFAESQNAKQDPIVTEALKRLGRSFG